VRVGNITDVDSRFTQFLCCAQCRILGLLGFVYKITQVWDFRDFILRSDMCHGLDPLINTSPDNTWLGALYKSRVHILEFKYR
jgi:hypothetical protein